MQSARVAACSRCANALHACAGAAAPAAYRYRPGGAALVSATQFCGFTTASSRRAAAPPARGSAAAAAAAGASAGAPPPGAAAAAAGALTSAFKVKARDLVGSAKPRLDAYLAVRLPDASRAKIQSSIKEGLVTVNGAAVTKASHVVKSGDAVTCTLLPPPPQEAVPEAIPLNIVYEDDQLIVVNKPAGMVVHLSAGHATGTLVNALLHHCGLPAFQGDSAQASLLGIEGDDDDLNDEDESDEEPSYAASLAAAAAPALAGASVPSLRPGIVHRLDKGTTGLLVVAKDERSHRHLCAQFKARTVDRTYWAIALGRPPAPSGRVETNIDRDIGDRKRMAAYAYGSARGRTAASNYKMLEPLAGGRASLLEWKLDTGRTHQIRVHARHLGIPLLGDDTYGGGVMASAGAITRGKPSAVEGVKKLVTDLGRPALHALTLGFEHPVSGKRLMFDSPLAEDFASVLAALRHLKIGSD